MPGLQAARGAALAPAGAAYAVPVSDAAEEAAQEEAAQEDEAAEEAAPTASPVSPDRRRRLLTVLFSVATGVVILDQVTKALAVTYLEPRILAGDGPVPLLGSFLQLTFTRNSGAAFSLLTGFTWIFTAIAVAVVVVIVRTSRRLASLGWAVALGGLLGGSLGNLIDRLTREPGFGTGYVVDFLQLPYWPVFNVADMSIVGSAILMVVLTIRGIEYDGGGTAAPATPAE